LLQRRNRWVPLLHNKGSLVRLLYKKDREAEPPLKERWEWLPSLKRNAVMFRIDQPLNGKWVLLLKPTVESLLLHMGKKKKSEGGKPV
jgi:hypothetical protein